MNEIAPIAFEVKKANRRLYDAIARDYEAIDGRRNGVFVRWIRSRLTALAAIHGDQRLLDLGSGSGVVSRAAKGLFHQTIALDISPGILAAGRNPVRHRVAADVDQLPLAPASIDVACCIAVLHHLADSSRLAHEIARILRPGGVFWSDHDMDQSFYRRFRWPLGAYRLLRRTRQQFAGHGPAIDERTYHLAECRETGVPAEQIIHDLQEAGLLVRAEFHWFGLSPVTNALFSQTSCPRGWAPLLRITAVQPGWERH